MSIKLAMKSIKSIIKEMHSVAADHSSEAGAMLASLFNDVRGSDDGDIDLEVDIEIKDSDAENFQGDIRDVNGASLVYKREQSDGNYDELWVLNVGKDYDDNYKIQRDILAGTDIESGKLESEDGSQQLELYSVGNIQFLYITGMPH